MKIIDIIIFLLLIIFLLVDIFMLGWLLILESKHEDLRRYVIKNYKNKKEVD